MLETLESSAILASVDSFRGSFLDLDNNCRVDARDFARGWRDLARQLGKRGLSAGHRVVMAVNTGPLFPAALAAVLSRGATPLLVHGSTPLLELINYAQRIAASFVLRDPHPAPALDKSGFVSAEVVVAGAESDNRFATVVLYQVEASDDDFESNHSLRGVPLHPTSGTTGESKIAARAGNCCIEEARHIIDTIEVQPRDRFLICVPMSHAYGYGTGTMVPIVANATIVTQRYFNPRAALRALSAQEITIFPAVPAMLDLMLKVGNWPDPPPRHILSAGSPLSERVAREFRDKLKILVRPFYGTTETGTISIGASKEAYQLGYVGRAMRGVEINLKPLEDTASDAKDIGVLHVRSSSMMSGYFRSNRDELEPVPDGWFDTGDLAKIDSMGGIHLVGRAKEIINVSGLKVIPREVEGVLAALEGVVEVVVYAGKHRSGFDIVKAAVVASRPLQLSGVRAHCEQYLVAYKRPEIVSFLSTLPRSPAGKILRDQLP